MMTGNGNGNGNGPRLDSIGETAARGVEAIHLIVQQRDDLLRQVDRLSTDNVLYRERCTQQEQRLTQTSAERDHYMRYTTELTARLNNILTLINSTIEESKRAAYRPTQVTKQPDVVLAEDAKNLQSLLQRLQPPSDNGEAK